MNLLKSVSDKNYFEQDKKDIWKQSYYKNINLCKNDYVGRIGEQFIEETCKLQNIPTIYNKKKETGDGIYDIIIYCKKVQIKTAKRGTSNNTFQHECLSNNSCDYHIFVDVSPHYFYISVIPKFDLREPCKIFGKKATLRKKTNDVFKFDLTEKQLKKGISKNFTLKIDENVSSIQIGNFIKSHFL